MCHLRKFYRKINMEYALDHKKTVINACVAFACAVLISSYILFGDIIVRKKNKSKKRQYKDLIPGLYNPGNVCFLNCILQSMASCPLFMRWLFTDPLLLSSTNLLDALRKILHSLNDDTEADALSASNVMQALHSHGWKISLDEQDAHEMFLALIQTLNDELEKVSLYSNSLLNISWLPTSENISATENTLEICESNNTTQHPQYLRTSSKKKLKLEDASLRVVNENNCDIASIISKVDPSIKQNLTMSNPIKWMDCPFKGYLASHLQCYFCGCKKPKTLNTFNSISLTIPDRSNSFSFSLKELLDEYVHPEYISDVTCDDCSKVKGSEFRSSFSKQLTIAKLPECLCFHIQRITWTANSSAIKKNDYICFPLILNMEPYTYTNSITKMQQSSQETEEKSNGNIDSSHSLVSFSSGSELVMPHQVEWKDSCMYALRSVIVHVGDHYSGHFITYRKGNDNSKFKDKWFYASDTLVKEVSMSEVLQANAYMILYEKIVF